VSHFQILPDTGNRGPHSKEIKFLEIRNRYKWMLQMGGQRVLLYKKRYSGIRCPNMDKVRHSNQQHDDNICYGTGYTGGYYAPIEIYVSLLPAVAGVVTVKEFGRSRDFTPTSWTLWEPLLTTGDFIVLRNNTRMMITDVSQTHWKHYVLRQNFTVTEIERNNIIYKIPIQL
jgi:hypothetical protein